MFSTMTLNQVLNITNSSPVDIFNFSIDQAIGILEEYLLRDHNFDGVTEIIVVISYVFLMAVGILSNILISYVILANRRDRSYRNLFILNLNISDIALCAFCMPFTLFELLRRSWPLGILMCKLVPFVQGSTVFVSAATVTAIALDRHYVIVNQNPNRCKENKKYISLYTGAMWIISLILSLPICLSQTIKSVGLPGILVYEKCIEQWAWPHGKGLYTLMIMTVQLVIPATVLAVMHFRIKAHLNMSIAQHDSSCSERLNKELSRNRRATMILSTIAIVFTISWLPWNVLNLVADFHPSSMSPRNLYVAFAACHLIAMTSAVTNPILYGWLNTNIRQELIRMVTAFLSMKGNSNIRMEFDDSNVRTALAEMTNVEIRKSPNLEFNV
ncbi:neuropeptide F receptor-like [Centruroides vittatus]|uniref:neuropeptide F receptor-like n=1 Tax=Centruroides vittatus TaxID=120091 RepID=UPI0035103C81